MSPTYRPGEQIAAERIDGSEVCTGDVVLLQDPWWFPGGELSVVRVVGGDRVACCAGGRVSIGGEPLAEPYARDGDPVGVPGAEFDVTVPEGRLFLLGGHRANAFDCRFRRSEGWSGTVSVDAVRGRVLDGVTAPALLLGAALTGAALAAAGACPAAVPLARRRRRTAPPPSAPVSA